MSNTKRKMSKRLKNMNFMKRKTNSEKRKTKQNDKKAKIEAMQWIQSEAAESSLIIDDRRDEYMMYRTGRKSFGSFNIPIEKMQKESIETIRNQSISQSHNQIKPNKNKNNKKRNLSEFQSDEADKNIITGNECKRQKTDGNVGNVTSEAKDCFIKPQALE